MSMKCMRCGRNICIDETLILGHMVTIDSDWNANAVDDNEYYLCQACAEGMTG